MRFIAQRIRAFFVQDILFVVAVLSAVAGLLVLGYSRDLAASYPWQSAMLQNFGSSLVFVYFALGVLDYATERARHRAVAAELARQEARWAPVREHIDHYVLNVARTCALAYRIGAGIGDDDLPYEQLREQGIEGLRGTQRWIEEAIVPRLPNLGRRDREGWQRILEILETADQNAERVITQFSSRLEPETYAAILQVQRDIERAIQGYELEAPLLGVPLEEIVIRGDDQAFVLLRLGVEKYGGHPNEIILAMRSSAEKHVVKDAKRVLRSAVSLIDIVIPYFTSERGLTLDDEDDEDEADGGTAIRSGSVLDANC